MLIEMQVHQLPIGQKPMNRHQRRVAVAQQRNAEIQRYEKEISKKSMFRLTTEKALLKTGYDFINTLGDLLTVNRLIKIWLMMNQDPDFEGLICNLRELIRDRESSSLPLDAKRQSNKWYLTVCDGDQTVDEFLETMVKMTVAYPKYSSYGEFDCQQVIIDLGKLLEIDLKPIFTQKLTKLEASCKGYHTDFQGNYVSNNQYANVARDFHEYQFCHNLNQLNKADKNFHAAREARIEAMIDDDY